MASGVFSWLMATVTPRSDNYFVLFNHLADRVVNGAKVMAKMSAVSDAEKFEEHCKELRTIEREADEYTKEILISLHKTFITPFDRREIRELAKALDDIVDYMEDIPQSVNIYGRTSFTPEIVALSQLLLRASEKVREAGNMLGDIKSAGRILRTCDEISGIESQSDHVMSAGMRRAFTPSIDSGKVIRFK